MFNEKNKEEQSISPKIKQVIEACDAIFHDCLQNDIGFQAYKHFRIEDIKAKRIELGYEAGSNTTIIKGKNIWLEQNKHRLANPSVEVKKEDDPMFGLVQKIRADLQHEADEKIEQAQASWNEEKESLVQEADNLAEQLEKLDAEHQEKIGALNSEREQNENLRQKCEEQFLAINFSKGDQARLQQVNDSLQAKLEELYIKYEREADARELAFKRLSEEFESREESRIESLRKQQQLLKSHFDSEKKELVDKLRCKDEELMQLSVENGNLVLNKERLETENNNYHKSMASLTSENKELLAEQKQLEGEVKALQAVIAEFRAELINSKRDNSVLEAKLKSLEAKQAEVESND